MKKIFYSITLLLAVTALSLSSCLKDSRYVDLSNTGTLVELPLAAYTGANTLTVRALPIETTPQTFPLVINIASANVLKTAVNVTLEINTDTITSLNNLYDQQLTAYDNDTTGTVPPPTAPGHYSLPPANAFSVSSLTATIPAGQRTASVTVAVTTSNFDLNAYYIIPITLVNASGQKISNYNTVIFNVQGKNAYDGEWTVTGTMQDHSNAALTGRYPVDYYLETQSANSVALFDHVYSGTFGHEITNNGGPSYYGNFSPIFQFDANNNVVAVTNYYGQGTNSSTRGAVLDATGVNKFTSGTPGSKGAVFQVSYWMTQGGANRTHFAETYTYVGARP